MLQRHRAGSGSASCLCGTLALLEAEAANDNVDDDQEHAANAAKDRGEQFVGRAAAGIGAAFVCTAVSVCVGRRRGGLLFVNCSFNEGGFFHCRSECFSKEFELTSQCRALESRSLSQFPASYAFSAAAISASFAASASRVAVNSFCNSSLTLSEAGSADSLPSGVYTSSSKVVVGVVVVVLVVVVFVVALKSASYAVDTLVRSPVSAARLLE